MPDVALRLEEVFKIGGVPTYTFVEPAEYARLKVALRTPGRGLIVEGPSGIGKSTAVTRALAELGSTAIVQQLSARNPGDVGYIEILATTEDFGTVVIDDFHVLRNDTRGEIADLLKRLADTESTRSKLIIVGINRAGDSLIDHAPDLANRLDTIRFEVEPDHKVRELITAGEAALNVRIDAKPKIIEGAQGSFYLAQLLCHALCTEEGVTDAPATCTKLHVPYNTIKRNVMDRQERRFGKAIMGFVRGPHFRPSGRANYLHILSWLKDSQTWSISLSEELAHHPTEKASVGQVVEKGWLAKLASTEDIAKIIHYDPATRILSVEDPQLIFYLRNLNWSEFVQRTGFTRIDVEQDYDFALSFAGEDRQFARRLYDHLEEQGFSVFYDQAEQHRILAEDLEEFLGPIYRSNASYVIAILGRQYGQRRWTRFESAQFEKLFGDHRVIPIWAVDAMPTAFDMTAGIGGTTFDPYGDIDDQSRSIAELCGRKLDV
jgi:hypothetical protein